MDPVTVAAEATPFLVKAAESLGGKIWDRASDAAADEAAGFGRRLLDMLLRRRHGDGPDADPGADAKKATSGELAVAEAVTDVVVSPGDQDARAALRLAVRKLLAADPQLLAEVAEMVQTQAPRQQAGDRSIQIGGSQHGGVNVTGDDNEITYGGPGPA